MTTKRSDEIEALRKSMGTLPEMKPEREDAVLWGADDFQVELVDYPTNPYRGIYDMATATWGGRHQWWKRWENATPEGRLKVVLAVLGRKTLGQPLETGKFSFRIQGPTRASFDQMARHRFANIGSVGSRDNSHEDAAIVFHPSLKDVYEGSQQELEAWWTLTKDIYCKIVNSGKSNWQNARESAS